jgi:thiamine biosynthesis lipoprotein
MSQRLVHVEHVWDTVVSIHLLADDDSILEDTRDDIVRFLHHVDEVFSGYRNDSALCRWQRGEMEASAELAEVLGLAEALEEMTDGYFDLRWNGLPDPTGVVKGWAVDRSVELAHSRGIADLMINAGGDVRTCGSRGDGEPWRVGIVDPDNAQAVISIVTGNDVCVATSGASERGEHIRVRETRTSVSASVVGPNLAIADALATAAISAGDKAFGILTRFDGSGWASFLVREDGSQWKSPSWQAATLLAATPIAELAPRGS